MYGETSLMIGIGAREFWKLNFARSKTSDTVPSQLEVLTQDYEKLILVTNEARRKIKSSLRSLMSFFLIKRFNLSCRNLNCVSNFLLTLHNEWIFSNFLIYYTSRYFLFRNFSFVKLHKRNFLLILLSNLFVFHPRCIVTLFWETFIPRTVLGKFLAIFIIFYKQIILHALPMNFHSSLPRVSHDLIFPNDCNERRITRFVAIYKLLQRTVSMNHVSMVHSTIRHLE